jgi:hypothetical protein
MVVRSSILVPNGRQPCLIQCTTILLHQTQDGSSDAISTQAAFLSLHIFPFPHTLTARLLHALYQSSSIVYFFVQSFRNIITSSMSSEQHSASGLEVPQHSRRATRQNVDAISDSDPNGIHPSKPRAEPLTTHGVSCYLGSESSANTVRILMTCARIETRPILKHDAMLIF